jgi:hypothetical protein
MQHGDVMGEGGEREIWRMRQLEVRPDQKAEHTISAPLQLLLG